jgi:hypothetical protein
MTQATKIKGGRGPAKPAAKESKTAGGHVSVEIEAERRNPELMARRKAQADQERREDERHMADAIQRFDEFLRSTSTERLPKLGRGGSLIGDGYLVVRKAAGSGFVSAWPVAMKMLDAELEVRRCRADGLNVVRRLDKVVLVTEPAATGKPDRRQIEAERAVGAAETLRDSMLLPVWTMPGPIGDALRKLKEQDPDLVQLVNLRAKRMSFTKIAHVWRRKGAEDRPYTHGRCQQLIANVLKEYPALKCYIDGNLADARTGKLPEDETSDEDWIEKRTTESMLDPADYGRGIHCASKNSRIRD